MRKMAVFVVTLLAAVGSSAGPAAALFDYYQEPQPPVAGDCATVAASVGAGATWYGEFAGNRYDEFLERQYPFSVRGCFESEYACKVWQHEALTYTGRGGLVYMRCRPGAPVY